MRNFSLILTLLLSLPLVACDDDSDSCDASKLDAKITSLTDDLNACNSAVSKKPQGSKSGTRLKIYNYVSDGGAQWDAPYIYDSVKKKGCDILDLRPFSEYGCNASIYCNTTDRFKDVKQYLSPNSTAYANEYHYYILRDCFDSFDSSRIHPDGTYGYQWYSENASDIDALLRAHYPGYFKDGYGNISIWNLEASDNNPYYLDSSCTTPLVGYVINDSSCKLNSDSIIAVNAQGFSYYRPKSSTFTTVYRKGSTECTDYSHHFVFLEKLNDATLKPYIDTAKNNLKYNCSQICTAINKEAAEEDWVELHLEEAR